MLTQDVAVSTTEGVRMMSRHNTWIGSIGAAALAVFVIGCASQKTPEAVRPTPLNEIDAHAQPGTPRLGSDPVSDLPGRIIVGILTTIGDPARDSAGQTIILMPDLVNRSSAPNRGVIELGSRLRAELAGAGEPSRMVFVAEDQLGAAGRAHYVLEGEVYAVQRQGQRYWEVFFTLFDVSAETGRKQDRRWENARGYLVER